MKLQAVCTEKEIVGLHITGPNAGEILQGFTTALRYMASHDEVFKIRITNSF